MSESEPIPDEITNAELLEQLRGKLSEISFSGIGHVEAIVTTPNHDTHVMQTKAKVIPSVGVDGDGPYKKYWQGQPQHGRQISAVNAEVFDALGVPYDVSGDNLIIRGIDLGQFEPGDGLRVGDAVLVATGVPHRPCALFATRTTNAHLAAITEGRLRGTFFDALDETTIQVGDSVERVILNRPG